MKDFPESYRDPVYASLDAANEQKHGLPAGLLASVRENGEKTNHSQVGVANAKTKAAGVYQFIPSTAKAILDKYGVDVTLSPENASEGAALLLKEGLQRNKGDPALAVAEYTGGLDRKAWGPVTKAYVQRVTGALPSVLRSSEPSSEPAPAAPQGPWQAKLYDAYRAGRMDPAEEADYEQAVSSGQIELGLGKSLKRKAEAPAASAAYKLPPSVIEAYQGGKMTPEEKSEFESVAQSNPEYLPEGFAIKPSAVSMIPTGSDIPAPQATAQYAPTTPQSFGQKIIGAGEAGLSALSAGTTGIAGQGVGLATGLAEQILSGQYGTQQAANAVDRKAAEFGQAATYSPRGVAGQQILETVGDVAQALPPVPAFAPLAAEAQALRAGTAGATQAARIVAPAVAQRVAQAPGLRTITTAAGKVKEIPATVSEAVSKVLGGAPRETPQTAGASVGAAGTEAAAQRRATAAGLDIPIDLTEGQATRDPAQLKFEVETAKHPEAGGRLRQNLVDQNEKILQNFDTWIDQTGAKAPTLRAVGTTVDDALVKASNRDKTHVNVAYAEARKSPESKVLVDQNTPVTFGEGENAISNTPLGFLNERATGLATTTLADAAKQHAIRLGIAEMEDGKLVAKPATIRQLEEWRTEISQSTGYEPTDIRTATILKGLIDGQTEPVAGPLYRQARGLRTRYAQVYENNAVIAKLLNTKRGTSDRHVAFEDVLAHSILKGSLDDVRKVQQVLLRSGPDGKQAWTELKGATVQWIKNEATKNIATDASGNRILSPSALDSAIKHLDHDGKLERIFGKAGAQKLRDANEVAQIARTVPPEAAINTSNTAMTLLSSPFLSSSADIAISMLAGVPAPVITSAKLGAKHIKDVKLRKRIDAALAQTQH